MISSTYLMMQATGVKRCAGVRFPPIVCLALPMVPPLLDSRNPAALQVTLLRVRCWARLPKLVFFSRCRDMRFHCWTATSMASASNRSTSWLMEKLRPKRWRSVAKNHPRQHVSQPKENDSEFDATARNAEEDFAFGLDIILDGLEQILSASKG